MAKGLTNGAVPMGAVAAANFVHDSIVNGAAAGIELFHGYTYSAHPLAAAAGLATLAVYEDEQLFARAARLAPIWEDAIHSLADVGGIIDIRTCRTRRRDRAGTEGGRARCARQSGVPPSVRRRPANRVTGDIIALSPPLIASEAQVDEIAERLRAAIIATID